MSILKLVFLNINIIPNFEVKKINIIDIEATFVVNNYKIKKTLKKMFHNEICQKIKY